MYCENCGAAMAPGRNFCGKCGNSISNNNILGQADSIRFSPQPARQGFQQNLAASTSIPGFTGDVSRGVVQTATSAIMGRVIIAAVSAAIIIAGIILYNMFFVTHPHDVVEKFFNAINEKDLNTAISCLDPQYEKLYNVSDKILGNVFGVGLKDVSDLLPFIYNFQQAQSGDDTDRFIELEKTVSETITNNTAVVVVQVSEKDEDGNRIDGGTGEINLKKFNEGWRIVSME